VQFDVHLLGQDQLTKGERSQVVKIRLRRVGAKKQPSYRVVVADARAPRDGRFIEIIGHYNPRTEPPTVHIKRDRALYWLQQGAQATDAVARLLEKEGLFEALRQVKAGVSPAEALAATLPVEVPPVEEAMPAVEEVEAEPEAEEVPPEALPLEDLDLSARVYNALQDAELTTVGDVLELLAKGDAAVLELPNVGGKALEEIKDKLRGLGLIEE
jgi:small subunit ribosomal protein S16